MSSRDVGIKEPGSFPRPLGLRGYDAKALSNATAVDTGPDSFTQQHMREEVDINTIVRRFGITRGMPSGVSGGVYGDFTGIEDYAGAVAAIERAREGFMTLPPDVRERFGNDPGQMVAFAESVDEDEFTAVVRPNLVPAGSVDAPIVVPPVVVPPVGNGS